MASLRGDTQEEVINFAWGKGLTSIHQMEKWRKGFLGLRKIVGLKHGCSRQSAEFIVGESLLHHLRRVIHATLTQGLSLTYRLTDGL